MDKGNDLIEELEIRKTIDGEPVGEHSPTGTPLRGTMEKGGTGKKTAGLNQIKNEITDIAFSAAAAVVEKDMTGEDNERLIEKFIDNVGEM